MHSRCCSNRRRLILIAIFSSLACFSVSKAVVNIGVFSSDVLQVVSDVIGWIYFIAWSISFYPQIYENWRRKSVVGLNFDFLTLNIIGFSMYSLYNVGLYWIHDIQVTFLVMNGSFWIHFNNQKKCRY